MSSPVLDGRSSKRTRLKGVLLLDLLHHFDLAFRELVDLSKSRVTFRNALSGMRLLSTCRAPVPRAYVPSSTNRALFGIHRVSFLPINGKPGSLHASPTERTVTDGWDGDGRLTHTVKFSDLFECSTI